MRTSRALRGFKKHIWSQAWRVQEHACVGGPDKADFVYRRAGRGGTLVLGMEILLEQSHITGPAGTWHERAYAHLIWLCSGLSYFCSFLTRRFVSLHIHTFTYFAIRF